MRITNIKPDYKHHLLVVMALFCVIFFIGAAYAENKPMSHPAKNACKADYEQYCQYAAGDKRAIARCMKKNESQLSTQCRTAIKHAQARFRKLLQACQHDVQQQCADVQSGNGRIFRCLQQHEDTISTQCRGALQDVGVH